MLTIQDLKDIKGKVVVVRVDFNVPIKNGVINDDNRIVAALPTIKDLQAKGAKVVLLSHLGKISYKDTPEKIEEAKKANDLLPVAKRLETLLGQPVAFSAVTRGEELVNEVKKLQDGQVLLVQNTRYEKGEEKNDEALASFWASFADGFVMDAFGSAHRAHASTVGLPQILKNEGKFVAEGYLVEKEVNALSKCVNPTEKERPYIAVLGGFKVSDKIKVIESLLKITDKILIGGAMAYTFLKALGFKVGASPVEEDQLEYAKKCFETGKILLPVDNVISNDFNEANEERIIKTVLVKNGIPDGFEGLDIGPKTIKLYSKELKKAKMVFWNGPMGVFEQKAFQNGTIAICKAITSIKDAFTVIGGGDSASAAKQFGYKDKFSHVSTGGGASLEMIENEGHLPGIDVLK
jgi:phosphoglycerate kinase